MRKRSKYRDGDFVTFLHSSYNDYCGPEFLMIGEIYDVDYNYHEGEYDYSIECHDGCYGVCEEKIIKKIKLPKNIKLENQNE